MKYSLTAQSRSLLGRKVKHLRSEGLIPASVFGRQTESLNLQVNTKEFLKQYKQVGESTLLYLDISGEKEPRPTLVSSVAYHPVTDLPLHVSFMQVDLKEKVTAPVKIVVVGESPAEKDGLGILVQQLDEVEIEALPTDMPEQVEVDAASLTAVDQAVFVKDLQVGAKAVVKSPPDTIIVKIEPLAKEEVAAAPAAPVEGEAAPAGESAPAEPAAEKDKSE